MTDKVRLGIIGLGFGHQVLLPAFRADNRCEVVAVCSKTLDKARRISKECEIEKFTSDWTDLVETDDLQGLVIATPAAQQVEIARAAMAAGKSVFCEKPVSVTVEDALSLRELARKSGVAHMVDFEFCESPAFKTAKQTLDNGALGSLHFVNVTWTALTYENRAGLSTWKSDSSQGGSVLNLFGSHVFYYLEWFLGPIRQLSAHLTPRKNLIGEATAQIQCVTESGIPATISICTEAAIGSGHNIEFFGSNGTLHLRNNSKDYVSGFEVTLTTKDMNAPQTLARVTEESQKSDGRILAVGQLAHRFVTWILDGTPSSPNIDDGLRVQSLLTASHESNETGRVIECAPLQCAIRS